MTRPLRIPWIAVVWCCWRGEAGPWSVTCLLSPPAIRAAGGSQEFPPLRLALELESSRFCDDIQVSVSPWQWLAYAYTLVALVPAVLTAPGESAGDRAAQGVNSESGG